MYLGDLYFYKWDLKGVIIIILSLFSYLKAIRFAIHRRGSSARGSIEWYFYAVYKVVYRSCIEDIKGGFMCRSGRVETANRTRVVLACDSTYRQCFVYPKKSTVNVPTIQQPSIHTHER